MIKKMPSKVYEHVWEVSAGCGVTYFSPAPFADGVFTFVRSAEAAK